MTIAIRAVTFTFAILAVHCSASPITTAEQLSQTFRESVSQAILARPRPPSTTWTNNAAPSQLPLPALQPINFPLTRSASSHVSVVAEPVEIVQIANLPADSPLRPSAEAFEGDIDGDNQDANDGENDANKNAYYSFDSSVKDTINGHSHSRQETRDGLSLKGSYSYSDGFFHRTVHYQADENGYRVLKEEIIPIGDGPSYNPQGTAEVSSSLTGSYTINADDFKTSSTTSRTNTENA